MSKVAEQASTDATKLLTKGTVLTSEALAKETGYSESYAAAILLELHLKGVAQREKSTRADNQWRYLYRISDGYIPPKKSDDFEEWNALPPKEDYAAHEAITHKYLTENPTWCSPTTVAADTGLTLVDALGALERLVSDDRITVRDYYDAEAGRDYCRYRAAHDPGRRYEAPGRGVYPWNREETVSLRLLGCLGHFYPMPLSKSDVVSFVRGPNQTVAKALDGLVGSGVVVSFKGDGIAPLHRFSRAYVKRGGS